LGRAWHERGTYGNILKGIIQKQLVKYQKERDRIKATKIAQNIGYLIQVQSGLITSHRNIEERIQVLENLALSQKGFLLNEIP